MAIIEFISFNDKFDIICSLKLLWLTLTQIQTACEIEFLPVYVPSDEEKKNPKTFANNVRKVMAK